MAVDQLVRVRGGIRAVDGISFEVDHGRVFGLLGPNGAGKTSTIEVLEGLDSPTSGSVRVLGYDMPRNAPAVKQRIGVQLQTTGLPRYLTVEETLRLFQSFYDPDRVRSVDDLVGRMGLEAIRRRLNARLSGGERQRVALALALVNDPDILFLDEPSAGLDPHARRQLWTIISDWRSSGKTIFLTTHDMNEAESLCDHVAIMSAGRVVAQGSIRELLASLGSEQSLWIEAADETMSAQFPSLVPAISRVIPEADGTVVFTPNLMAALAGLLELRQQGAITFESVQVRSPSLEDVFLKQTGQRFEGHPTSS